jgi:hypothetical protein
MAASVMVNKLTVVHKDSAGVSAVFPDVCKTPSPAGPVPIPYPNVAMSKDTADGSSTVKMDGQPIMLKSSNFALSTGDEAGSALGVASNKIKGKAYPKLYSFDVKVDGENVFRLTDLMLQNGGSPTNTPPGTEVQPPKAAAAGSGPAKDPEVPEVTKLQWVEPEVACGDVAHLEVETTNLGSGEVSVNVLRKKPSLGDHPTRAMNGWFTVKVSGDKAKHEWITRRGYFEQKLEPVAQQTSYKGVKVSNELKLKTAPDANELKLYTVTTPQYLEQDVDGFMIFCATGANYEWPVGYEIAIKDGRFSVTRKIDFKLIDGAKPSDRTKRSWKKEIEAVWNRKFKLHRVACKRGDKCDCPMDQGCCSYVIHIQCEWGGGQGPQTELHKGANSPKDWGGPKWWYSHTWWEKHRGVPRTVRAHEFGHQIGMYDEYPQGACDPGRIYTDVPESIMSAGKKVYERHFKDFHDWFDSKASGALGATKLIRV